MSTTAGELNQTSTRRRRKAAEDQPNVNVHEKAAERHAFLLDLVAEKSNEMLGLDEQREIIDNAMDELRAQKKSLNSEAKAIYDDLMAEGVDKEAFKYAHAQRKLTDEQRIKHEAARRLCWTALDLEQGETVDFIRLLEEDVHASDDADLARQIGEHLDKHGSTPKH